MPQGPRHKRGSRKKAREVHKSALSCLPPELQAKFSPGPIRQRFEAAFDRLSGGRAGMEKSMTPWRISIIAKAAADAVLKKPAEVLQAKPKRSVIDATRWGNFLKRLGDVDRKALEWLPQKHRVIFPSGARGVFVANIGRPLPQFDIPGPITYVSVRPAFDKRKHPEFERELAFKHGRDFVEAVGGSIGHVAIKFHKPVGSEKPVLVVWNVQERVLSNLPDWFRRRYRNWNLHLLNYLEEIARGAGAEKIAVIGPGHAKKMGLDVGEWGNEAEYRRRRKSLREHVVKYYEGLAAKLMERGFVLEDLRLGIKDRKIAAQFLVKKV